MSQGALQKAPDAKLAFQGASRVSPAAHTARAKTAGIVFRSLLLLLLALMGARVSTPQHFGSTWYDVPLGDLIRIVLGFVFCLWALVEIFILPKDPASYQTWVYVGATLLPLGLTCLIVVW